MVVSGSKHAFERGVHTHVCCDGLRLLFTTGRRR